MSQEFYLVYMTAPNAETAERLAKVLVEERLAACVNLIPGMRSYYWWDGAVQSGDETIAIAKTTVMKLEALKTRALDLHPDETPCLVAWPLTEAACNAAFLQWIEAETLKPGEEA